MFSKTKLFGSEKQGKKQNEELIKSQQ